MPFRIATPDDAPALAVLQRAFYDHEGYDWPVSAELIRDFIADPSLGRFLIHRSGYMVLAFGFSFEFGGRDAFIDELYIADDARGQGLGSEALALAEDVCREAGVRALHLEVEHSNERVKRLYARNGYQEHSRFLMTKRLAP